MNSYTPKEAPAGYKECARYPGLHVNDAGQVFCERRGQLKLIKHPDECLVVNYRYSNGLYKQLKVHRLVAEAFIEGFTPECEVDHIFHNRSDNRVSQLRIVTHRGNQQNLKGKKEGRYTSTYPGVSYSKFNNLWAAYVRHGSQGYRLGYHTTEEAAYEAYLYGVEHLEELALKRADCQAKRGASR